MIERYLFRGDAEIAPSVLIRLTAAAAELAAAADDR
jgi:hypothetical protein